MGKRQTLQPDRKPHITTADNVLNLEFLELGVEAQLLDDSRVFTGGETRVVLGLGPGNDHLSGSEDQSGGLGVTNTHDDGSETLLTEAKSSVLSQTSLGVKAFNTKHTLGLYSAFLACIAIVFRSSLIPKFTVATMFLGK